MHIAIVTPCHVKLCTRSLIHLVACTGVVLKLLPRCQRVQDDSVALPCLQGDVEREPRAWHLPRRQPMD